jgi:hypothetical protein
VLGAEGGERAEGVGDAQEGGGVVADFEVRGALGDELDMKFSIYIRFCGLAVSGSMLF